MQPAQAEKTPKMLEIEKKFGKSLEEILREAYLIEKMTYDRVAKKLGVGTTTLGRWFNLYDIETRNVSEAKLPSGMRKPSEKQLRRLYERMSAIAISKKLYVSKSVVGNWLHKYGIKTRDRSEAQLPPDFVKPTKGQLHQMYFIEKMSPHTIGKKLKRDASTIRKWLRDYGIHVKDLSESHLLAGAKPSKEQLCHMYAVENIPSPDIAERLKVSTSAVLTWLRDYGIQKRSGSEIQLPAGFVKPSKDDFNQWYFVERMSPHEIGKKLGVSAVTVKNWLRKDNIQLRNIREARLPAGVKMPSKEQLHRLYAVEKLTTYDISKQLGVNRSTVCNWLRECGIPIRNSNGSCSKDAVKQLLNSYVGRDKYAS